MRVFRNDGNGVFVPGPELPFQFPASYTQVRLQPFVGDFDGDGDLDFVIARDGAAAPIGEGLEFYLGDGNLGWASRVLLPMSTPIWIGIGNIDGDAALEVAVDNVDPGFIRRLSWVDFQGGTPVALPPLTAPERLWATGDIDGDIDGDGDGDLDLLLDGGYRENDGAGLLPVFVPAYLGRGRQVADVDANGRPDVLTTTYSGSSTTVSIQLGGPGGFTTMPVAVRPLLGARRPIVSTSAADEMRLVRAWPGANALVVFGIVETTIQNAPLPGLVLHVGDPVAVFLPPLPGAPGVAGAGATTITLPNLPFLAGFTILHQVFSEDPAAPSGWASSNGLALTYGL